jgi:hypothetical protein
LTYAQPLRAVDLPGNEEAKLSWAPSSGEVAAYVVFVSRNGGPYRSEQYTPVPRARVAGQPGETVQVRVRAYGLADGRALTSEASAPSEPIHFREFVTTPAASATTMPLAKLAPNPRPEAGAPVPEGNLRQVPGFQFLPPLRVESAGDFDGDGDVDLIVTLGSWRHPFLFLLEDMSLARIVSLGSLGDPNQVLAADFDGDGIDDLALRIGQEVSVLRLETSGSVSRIRHERVPADARLLAADLDGDGAAGLLVYEPGTGRLTEKLTDRDTDYGSIRPLYAFRAGDFNGDGRDDLWIQSRPGPDAELWLMHAGGSFSVAQVRLSRGVSPAAVVDVDGDGRSDLAGYDPTRGELRAWLLDGGRVLSERTLARGPVESVQRVDMDGDGLDDLLLRAPDGAASALILSP